MDWFLRIFETSDFPARWSCGNWSGVHGWTHIISDIAIFGAYVAIPFALAYFVRKRSDVPFPKVFWLFSAFILSCGFTHLIEATIFWHPWYRFSAIIKVFTAVVSWATVLSLLPLVPQALRFRSPSQLEREVAARTSQLASVNALLESKNQELEQFLYTVSHDLKAPLVTARGFLGQMRADLGEINDPDVIDSIDRIDRSTLRMGELLSDLLEFSRIGRIRNNPTWIDMHAMVTDIIASIPPSTSHADFRARIHGRLPGLYADVLRIRQLFDNLIANALKYGATEQQPEITIEGRDLATTVQYHVIDHGPGIPEASRSRVFLPFERLASGGEGTGIGLAVVAKIVAINNGTVDIETTPGGGATFVVTFPKPVDVVSKT